MPTITADSKPDYDEFGVDDYWSCDDWINWHKALKKKFGKQVADKTWTEAWNKQDSFESDFNWCKYQGTFNSYVRAENLNATWWLPNILNSITGIAEDASDAAKNTSNVLKVVIPVLVVSAAIGILIYAGKKFNIIP